MSFWLRYQNRDFDLSEGEFLIGRSSSCQLSLDDPLVSRSHAVLVVRADGVSIQDLGSRNGVRVNGQRIDGAREIADGDAITIGSQHMQVVTRRAAETQRAMRFDAAERAQSLHLLCTLADKAIALGRGEEAERILSIHLKQFLADVQSGHVPPTESAAQGALYAAKLAEATGKSEWFDYVIGLYSRLNAPPPASVVDELYGALGRVRQVDLKLLRSYIGELRGRAGLGPNERFLVGRVEGLERVAALK
jgi:pSer/pThr/pTyr-binding forkhead associated (FHA) protein